MSCYCKELIPDDRVCKFHLPYVIEFFKIVEEQKIEFKSEKNLIEQFDLWLSDKFPRVCGTYPEISPKGIKYVKS